MLTWMYEGSPYTMSNIEMEMATFTKLSISALLVTLMLGL